MSSSTDVDYIDNKYTEYYVSRGHCLKVLASEYDSLLPNMKTLILDASSEFDEKPTQAQLDDYTRWYVKNNDVGIPRVTIKVDVVDLASTEEYKDYAPLETVQLCDYVTIIFPDFGVDVKEQISKIEYNVLTDKNTSVTIGETKLTLADHLASNKDKLRKNKYNNQKWADRCAERAIRASSGWYGGNIRKNYNTTDHKQQSMYVMDTDNVNSADHALVMDGNGISGATGLSGSTQDGKPAGTDYLIALRNKYGNIGINGTAVNFGQLKTNSAGGASNLSTFDLETGENDIYMGNDDAYFHANSTEVRSLGLPVNLAFTQNLIYISEDATSIKIVYYDKIIELNADGVFINGTNVSEVFGKISGEGGIEKIWETLAELDERLKALGG